MSISSPTNSQTSSTEDSLRRKSFRWQKQDTQLLIGVSALAMLLFSMGLGSFGILDPSDGYYSEAAREMVESGNFITPHLNYKPFYDKPILTYWLIALSYKIFGVHEFAARIPSVLCGTGLVAITFTLVRFFTRRRPALFAALVLTSTPLLIVMAHMSVTDMPLAFCVWLAIASFVICAASGSRIAAVVGYTGLGLGLLAKGPLAAFLVALNVGPFLLLGYCRPSQFVANTLGLLRRLSIPLGLIWAALIAVPWYLAVNSATNGAFFQEFFVTQNLNRAMGVVDHRVGPWYYFPVVLGGFFPWTLLLIAFPTVVRRIWKTWWRRFADASQSAKLVFFATLSALLTFSFFTAVPTKLLTYVIPVMPALAILMGVTLDRLWRLGRKPASLTWTAPPLVAVAVALLIALPFALSNSPQILASSFCYASILAGAYIGYSFFLSKDNLRKALCLFLGGTVFGIAALVSQGIIVGYDLKCRDLHKLIKLCGERKIDPVLVGRRSPSATFYLHHPVRFVPNNEELVIFVRDLPAGKKEWFVVNDAALKMLNQNGLPVKEIERRGYWSLLSVEPVR